MSRQHWPRWIHSSIAHYLSLVAQEVDIPFLQEGVHDRTTSFMEAPTRLEGRVNGPFSREISLGYYEVHVDVNVLLSNQMGGQKRNVWDLDHILGAYHDAMEGPIPIYRFGTGPDDDEDSLLGCLNPRSGQSGFIRVFRFGQITETDRLTQGMVDASYEMHLDV